jgi:hypothetical protein
VVRSPLDRGSVVVEYASSRMHCRNIDIVITGASHIKNMHVGCLTCFIGVRGDPAILLAHLSAPCFRRFQC